jgi:LAO/AO transport system kinase
VHEDAEVQELLDQVVARRLDPASAASAILARGAVDASEAAREDQRAASSQAREDQRAASS